MLLLLDKLLLFPPLDNATQYPDPAQFKLVGAPPSNHGDCSTGNHDIPVPDVYNLSANAKKIPLSSNVPANAICN